MKSAETGEVLSAMEAQIREIRNRMEEVRQQCDHDDTLKLYDQWDEIYYPFCRGCQRRVG